MLPLCIKILLLTSRFYNPVQTYPQVIHVLETNWWITPFSLQWFSVIMEWGEVGRSGEIVRCVGNEGEVFLNEGEHSGILRRGSTVTIHSWVQHGRRNVSW